MVAGKTMGNAYMYFENKKNIYSIAPPKHTCHIQQSKLFFMNDQAQLLFSKENTDTFSLLYRKYWPLLCNYGSKYIDDPADVEELVTEVFIRF